ncbi:hypothetical protein Bca52824_023448 [Brassica carinata]|uniref:Uncharacterized protein n=1 Tax=Brassica carinata TaxID=52824 RepID=A0A8X7VIG7_BRACI|nr:hypothetical protein Bca52824_023448 [Brassica carinata]
MPITTNIYDHRYVVVRLRLLLWLAVEIVDLETLYRRLELLRSTFLGQSDPSASTSGTSSGRDNVPESQIPAAAPYVPPQAYDPGVYYPQLQAPHYDDPAAYYPHHQQSQEGAPPSLARLYKDTHQHSDGTFSHPTAERICNEVDARIQEVQTQLSQDKIFEQISRQKVSKKNLRLDHSKEIKEGGGQRRTRLKAWLKCDDGGHG